MSELWRLIGDEILVAGGAAVVTLIVAAIWLVFASGWLPPRY